MEPTLNSQEIVDIEKIENSVVFLKDGTLCKILTVGGINFDLKSEEEKEQILSSFGNFLNTLDFPIQFFIHSRKANITKYLEVIEERRLQESNELLKVQIAEYSSFIRSFIEENPIITKTFFVVIRYVPPLAALENGGFFKALKNFGNKKKETDKAEAESEEDSARQLAFRTEQAVNGLNTIGLRGIEMESEELIELYYNVYNPQLTDKKELNIAKAASSNTKKKAGE